MGYYMRFIVTDDGELNLNILETALKRFDQLYSIQRSGDKSGELRHGTALYGTVEVNVPGDDIFISEVEELSEEVEEAETGAKETVLSALRNAKAIVTVQVLWQNRQVEETLLKIDPIWTWLHANRKGLSQADGEGYYEGRNLILGIK